jgi:protein-S-isoprenylcysteine O-methyltransferase Ste14
MSGVFAASAIQSPAAMHAWLAIVMIWVAVAAGGAIGDVNVPWMVTIACWACLDLYWNRSRPADAPTAGPAPLPAHLRGLLPYALYCLPLSRVPILGLQWLPRIAVVQWGGAALCVAGVAFAICARRVLAKNWSGGIVPVPAHSLVQNGPYAIVRHPIYLGLLMAQVGMIFALNEVRGLVLLFGIDRLLEKLEHEESALRAHDPVSYERYSGRVKRLVPWVW